MHNNQVISINEAIDLIKSDTRQDPVVDTVYLVNASARFMRVGGNFTIKLLTRAKDGRIVENGSLFVPINSEWEKAQLQHVINEHYTETSKTHKVVDPTKVGTKKMTSVSDTSTGSITIPREVEDINTESIKKGESIK